MKTELIAQGPAGAATLEDALVKAAGATRFDRIEVAVAYATLQGVKTLTKLLSGLPAESYWVIGLDDAITQPEAIEFLMAQPGAKVRLAALAPARRFHPKLYCLSSSAQPDRGVSAVGSGNMTLHGLRKNGEAAVILTAETAAETQALRQQWSSLWPLGTDATKAAVDAYKIRYKAARKARKVVEDLGAAPPEPAPDAPVPPLPAASAKGASAWLEVGTATQGKELEIPKPMLGYFQIPTGATAVWLALTLPGGFKRKLRLIDRKQNGMWRIEFTAEVINMIAGRPSFYRPDGDKRSELTVTFQRQGTDELAVDSVAIGSPEHSALEAEANANGKLQRTIMGRKGRQFAVY